MTNWNISFGKSAQVVVAVALLATAGSIFFIYDYQKQQQLQREPQFVDPFADANLSATEQVFFRTVNEGDVRGVRRMLEMDASLARASVPTLGTALHMAATRDMIDVSRALLDAGADVNRRGPWGGTPLHWASWLGRADVVRLLIERGADVNARCTEFDSTPLFWASHGSANAPRYQYNRFRGNERPWDRPSDGGSYDPDATEQFEAQRTERRRQRQLDYRSCIVALIEAGASADTRNHEGVPAVYFATPSVAELLLDYGAKNDYTPPVLPEGEMEEIMPEPAPVPETV